MTGIFAVKERERKMNRDLMKKMGSMQQMAYVRKVTFEEGAAAGLRAYEVKAGELVFTVAADKCLDIVEMSYKGVNLNFLSKPGLMNGQRFDSNGFEAQKSIMGACFLPVVPVMWEDRI